MSSIQYTSALLQLEDVIINNIVDTPTTFTISIEIPRKPHSCPHCHSMTDKVHDYRLQKIHALPVSCKDTWLILRKRRYVCPHCGKHFYEDIPFLARYQRMTNPFRFYVLSRLHEMVSLKHIAHELYTTAPTIGSIFKQFVKYPLPQLPEVIALDEFKGNADSVKFQCILADPKNKQILDILPERSTDKLCAYFSQYSKEQRAKVKYVVMDMSTLFRSVIRICFPKAKIIVDRFHVCRLASWAMENVRKRIQKEFADGRRRYFKKSRWLLLKRRRNLNEEEQQQLAIMLNVSEQLRLGYRLKELFYEMMDSQGVEEAKARYKAWEQEVLGANVAEFNKVLETCRKWYKEIMASFEVPYSNGFIEGCNNKTKLLKRMCYGLSDYETLRNRRLCVANA